MKVIKLIIQTNVQYIQFINADKYTSFVYNIKLNLSFLSTDHNKSKVY